MQISPVALPAPSSPTTLPIDAALVPGLRLPVIDGLPDARSDALPKSRLGGPPAPGSAAARADMAVVKGAQLLRTPEGDAWARRMARDGTTRIWFDLARRERTLTGAVQNWLGVALLASTLASNAAVTAIAKHHFDRPRPFQVDPTIHPPIDPPHGASYPSGHASSAYAAARVIANLRPELAQEAYDLAHQVAASRVYAGVHFPSDVVAGAMLGTAIGELALRQVGRTGVEPADLAAAADAVADEVFAGA